MEHRTIKGVGGEVHYWISRTKDIPKGTIVFSHGLTANHTMFEKQIEYFKNEYIVIAWDVPMHGLSVPYNDFSYENTARDLHQIGIILAVFLVVDIISMILYFCVLGTPH